MTAAARCVLGRIAAGVDWAPPGGSGSDQLEIKDGPAAIASALPISDIAAGAYGALALAAAALHAGRGGGALRPFIDRRRAGLAMVGNEYLAVNGAAPESWDPLTGYYRCADGWLYLHANFPHLRDGLLAFFGAEATRAALGRRLQGWSAAEAEEKAQARGLCVMRLRAPTEWEAHPQRAALGALPLIAMRSGGHAAPRRPRAGALPLSGFRVLDLSRVIAGPMAGRALSELGADVLRISGPHLPFVEPLLIDTGFGKRNAHIDLRDEAGRDTLRALIKDADVMIDAYRPGALAARGFGPVEARALNPGLVHIGISAFGAVGPWAGRRGYDSYVQAGAGFTAQTGPGATPVRLACQPLDYLTGCLGAFAAVIGLIRRADGAGVAASLSLARTAIWLREMAEALGPDPSPPARNPSRDEVEAEGALFGTESDFGAVRALAPPYGFNDAPLRLAPPRRLGADTPAWLQELPS
ncbi:MAG: CoA transferase [Paracoccaceae bacterium]